MKERAMRLIKIALARDTLQLPPGLAAGMPIRADVAAAEPAAGKNNPEQDRNATAYR